MIMEMLIFFYSYIPYAKKKHIFATKMKQMNNNELSLLNGLKKKAKAVIPEGGEVWLYGSRARGDAHAGSDWDVLVLLNKDKIEYDDFEKFGYPLETVGWSYNAGITPVLYTTSEWKARSFTPFFKNVEHDKIKIL